MKMLPQYIEANKNDASMANTKYYENIFDIYFNFVQVIGKHTKQKQNEKWNEEYLNNISLGHMATLDCRKC